MPNSFIFLSFFIIFTNNIQPSYADDQTTTTNNTTQLVDRVCHNTTNYTLCVKALYSDSRTPDADSYTLAYISFGLAYKTATDSRRQIAELLRNASNRHGLERCEKDYKKGVEALGSALNDLNSETFFTLGEYANTTSRSAEDCQAHYKPLDSSFIKSLCEICVAVANLFNGGL